MVNAADALDARSNPGRLKMLNLPPIVMTTAQVATARVAMGSTAANSDPDLIFALAQGGKPETATSVVRPLSVEPLAATVNQVARQAAVAAIVADEQVLFDLSASETSADDSPAEDWLAQALD